MSSSSVATSYSSINQSTVGSVEPRSYLGFSLYMDTGSIRRSFIIQFRSAGPHRYLGLHTGGFPFCNFIQTLYASPAWWGFAGAQDRQKFYSFLRRSARVGFYSTDFASFDDLCTQADENLFNKVLHNPVVHTQPSKQRQELTCLRVAYLDDGTGNFQSKSFTSLIS